MSLKTVLGAAALSAVVFLGGTALILRGRERPQAAASPSAAQTRPVLAPGRDDVAPAPAVDAALEPLASGLTAAAPPASAAAEASSAGAGPVEVADADADAEESPRAVASAAAMEVRQAFQELKRRFGDGGGEGWRGVRDGIARMQELILGSEEGFLELLALVDAEEGGEGGSFLEALMHHLPLGGGELRERIVEHAELAGELWARYEAEESAGKRAALMRFFVFNRRLSASRMGEFVKLATDEPARSVRQLSIDALASNRELIEDTWQTLARVYDQDTDIECRETAIHGLAHARADEAAARIRAAFGSPDERIRAAALDSAAGEQLPGEVSGGDGPAYLVRELRAARSRRYKQALIGRLLESAPGLLESEIHGALAGEKDWGVQKDFREALKKIEAMREERRG